MADHEDQNNMISDNELPDLAAPGEELPDLGAGLDGDALPDLGTSDDALGGGLPDLDAGGAENPDMGASELPDMGDLAGNPETTDFSQTDTGNMGADDLQELPEQNTPRIATAADFGSQESVLAFKKIQGIKVRVQVMLGETKLSVSELANLKKGDFIQLDTKVGETVNILANGSLIARGEITVEDEESPRFGITLTEIVDASVIGS